MTRQRWSAMLGLLTACIVPSNSCAPLAEDVEHELAAWDEAPDLDADQRAEIRQAFDDATCFCLGHLGTHVPAEDEDVDDPLLVEFRARYGDGNSCTLSTASPRGARPGASRRLGGTVDAVARTVNACVGSTSLATELRGGVRKGLCQAELNYCIGNELRLKVASLSHAPSSVEVQDWIRTVAHERLGAAAIEYIGSLESYGEVCAPAVPAAWAADECTRLEGEQFPGVMSWRMSDAISQLIELVEEEAESAMARGDAIAPSETLGELDLLTRVWGVGARGAGARLQAAERIYGPFDHGATWTLDPTGDRSEVDLPVARHIQRDRHVNRMMALMQRFQVPFAHATQTTGATTDAHLVSLETVDADFVGDLYRLLDHRMAAAAYLGDYGVPEAIDLGVCVAPHSDDPAHCSPSNWPGASLRSLEPIDYATFDALADLPTDVSPLRRLGLTSEHLRDALGLGYDQLTTLSPTYDFTPQLVGSNATYDYSYDAVHTRTLQQRAPILLSAALSLYSPSTWGRSDPTPELHPHPSLRIYTGTSGGLHHSMRAERLPLIYQEARFEHMEVAGGGATASVRDTYTPGEDDTNYYTLRPERLHAIGAAGTAQIARVYLLRLMNGAATYVDHQSAGAALSMLDAALGGYWTEYNRQVQNPCTDVAFDGRYELVGMESIWVWDNSYPLCYNVEDPSAGWDYYTINPGVCTDRTRTAGQCRPEVGCAFDPATSACSDDPRGFWRLYFERGRRDTDMFAAGEPVAVRTMAEAQCLLAGRVCGAAPTVLSCNPVELEDAPIDPLRLTSAQRLGRDVLTCRPPDGSTFSEPADVDALATSRLFVFWRRQVEGGVYSYELIDVIRPAVFNEVHALGGEFANVMSDVLARDPLNPGRPAISSIGFDYDFVPPLENELTDDGDAIEDSWDRYLTDAETAAARAATLLTDARAAETDAVRNRITDRIAEDGAEIAQREVVSEICGTSSSAACNVSREAEVTLGELGLIPAPVMDVEPVGPMGAPVSEGGTGAVIPCSALNVETMARNFRIPPGVPAEWAGYVEDYLGRSLDCAYWNVLTAANDVVIHELPTRVRDELITNGDGNFADVDGSTREELATLYGNLVTIRQALRSFHDEYSVARVQVGRAAQDLTNTLGSNEEVWCKFGMVFGAVVAVVVSVVALVVSFGTAAVGSALAAAGAVAAAVAGYDECEAHYRRAEQQAGAALVETATSMSRLESYLYVAQGAVTTTAIADSRLDRAARRVEIAEARRELAVRGTEVDALSDMPEWQVLQDVRLRRAREAVRRAQQASWIARRAIEYRFASDMSLMSFDERFTPAPSSWVNDVFTLNSAAEGTSASRVYVNTAAEALQDHVRGLRDFARGYAFTHRFQEGTDFVVLDLAQLGARTGSEVDDLGVAVPFATTLLFRCPGIEELLPLTETGQPPCASPEWGQIAFEISPSRGTYIRDRLAIGNVNYRTEAVALNIVGTAVLDCSRAARPSECYGDGNIPFELSHDGEVMLENVDGELHTFVVDPAVIRGGRAIASERVLTNPLLTADRTLVTDFSRSELRGRPVDGQYVLRIYGRPEIVWNGIEGIQMALQYRYWTRQ